MPPAGDFEAGSLGATNETNGTPRPENGFGGQSVDD